MPIQNRRQPIQSYLQWTQLDYLHPIMIHFCETIVEFLYIAKAGAPVNIYVSMFTEHTHINIHPARHATQNTGITFLF